VFFADKRYSDEIKTYFMNRNRNRQRVLYSWFEIDYCDYLLEYILKQEQKKMLTINEEIKAKLEYIKQFKI